MQVLDPITGWAGFREHYSSNTWQWLTAATDARCENAFCCFLKSYLKYFLWVRFLLLSASMSESSLVNISGTNFSILCLPHPLPAQDINFLYLLKCITCNRFFQWLHDLDTLGIDRQSIKTFFKDPSRLNVYLQVRSVDRISIRFKRHLKSHSK